MENKIEKLEETIKFLKKELESQNLAILRLERALETGEGITGSMEKPSLTLADMEFALFGVEEKLKKHNDILKSVVISLVGVNDLLENIRDFFRSSVSEIKLDQQEHIKSFQRMFSGSIESVKAEFLMVLRDFREKYPELETLKIEGFSKNQKPVPTSTRTLESNDTWTTEQLTDLNHRMEEIELLIERSVDNSYQSVIELLSTVMTKTEELVLIGKDKGLKKSNLSPI